MKTECITIIGLGLIGGSLAKALKQKLNIKTIIAIDKEEKSLESAFKEKYIDVMLSEISSEIKNSDIVFIATPVDIAYDCISKVKEYVKSDCIISDLCSSKKELMDKICESLGSVNFIGGHPMAGSERFGYTASDSHLFENAYYILVPMQDSSKNNLDILSKVIEGIGAIPFVLTPSEHDMAIAAISHLPHIISASLVNCAKNSGSDKSTLLRLAAGGFKDITRISSSNPSMWQNICKSNKKSILKLIDIYLDTLSSFKKNLEGDNYNEIYDFFSSAKDFRDSFEKGITGLIPNAYCLIADVEDKPGVIANVSSLLYKEGINIKNIGISNSREDDDGVLNILFNNIEEMNLALDIMTKNGYKIKEH